MRTINESDFRDLAARWAVMHVRLKKHEGGYGIYVQMMWKENEDLLVTTRKTPRVWSDLDGFLQYLKDEAGFRGRLFIDLR